ncbi:MAG: hypothetical protein IT204_06730 [Fimbriimonadaceae bacterium]|nr:hypothetical protein [Fimbriimonadaceae bacterium]
MAIRLVCEGRPSSLDQRLLAPLLTDLGGLPVDFVPAGGKQQVRQVHAYLRTTAGPPALAVLDRDDDDLTSAEQSWAGDGSQPFVWTRCQIENYLLDPAIVAAALVALARAPRAGDLTAVPTQDLATWLLQAAADLRAERCLRSCEVAIRGELGVALGGQRTSYHVPTPVDCAPAACCTALVTASDSFRAACATAGRAACLRAAALQERWERTWATVCSAAQDSACVLRDFPGKRLLRTITDRLFGLVSGAARRAPDRFRFDVEAALIAALCELHRDGEWQHSDLCRLLQRAAPQEPL